MFTMCTLVTMNFSLSVHMDHRMNKAEIKSGLPDISSYYNGNGGLGVESLNWEWFLGAWLQMAYSRETSPMSTETLGVGALSS